MTHLLACVIAASCVTMLALLWDALPIVATAYYGAAILLCMILSLVFSVE
jgi:hypothetical protein